MQYQANKKLHKAICVFCSSSNRVSDSFKKQAFQLGQEIAKNSYSLVFGGATGGLMSAISEGASDLNGEIIGVIADPIIRMGRENKLSTTQVYTKNLNERKSKLKELSDIFVVLPGAFGTLDEMFDVMASASVGEHSKPLVCINLEGFYNPLIAMIDQMRNENLLPEVEKTSLYFVDNVEDCIELIKKM